MTDDNVKQLPVRFKKPPPEGRSVVALHEVRGRKCSHLSVQYIVDPAAAEVECGQCGEKLNPMWVLERLCTDDRRFADAMTRYQDEMKKLGERSRTKCINCGKMTPISNR